jgi:putative transcriptional regulator
MATKRKFKSDAFEAIDSSAAALHRVGAIGKATMKDFDATCIEDLADEARANQIAARAE